MEKQEQTPCPHCGLPLLPGEACSEDPAQAVPDRSHFSTPVRTLEVIDHGMEHSSSFQGCGTYGTDYEDVSTGVGSSSGEALEDALELLASGGWTVSDALEAQALEDLGSREERERDVVSPLEREAEEEALPAPRFRVSFRAWSGCSPSPADHPDKEDARGTVAWILRKRRAGGYPVSTLERGSAWEIREPEGCALVPDGCGTLVLSDNLEEREEERDTMRDSYPSELYCHVSVRVSARTI